MKNFLQNKKPFARFIYWVLIWVILIIVLFEYGTAAAGFGLLLANIITDKLVDPFMSKYFTTIEDQQET